LGSVLNPSSSNAEEVDVVDDDILDVDGSEDDPPVYKRSGGLVGKES